MGRDRAGADVVSRDHKVPVVNGSARWGSRWSHPEIMREGRRYYEASINLSRGAVSTKANGDPAIQPTISMPMSETIPKRNASDRSFLIDYRSLLRRIIYLEGNEFMTQDIVAQIEMMIEEPAGRNSDEADSLRRIKAVLDAGYTIDDIHKMVAYLTQTKTSPT
jgi:hypothetical protein